MGLAACHSTPAFIGVCGSRPLFQIPAPVVFVDACEQFVEYLADLAKSLGGIARATQGEDVRNAALQAYETAVAAYTTRLEAMRDHDPPQLAPTEFKARYKTALQVKGRSVSLFLTPPADQETRVTDAKACAPVVHE